MLTIAKLVIEIMQQFSIHMVKLKQLGVGNIFTCVRLGVC
jgi:hypothetical protein